MNAENWLENETIKLKKNLKKSKQNLKEKKDKES